MGNLKEDIKTASEWIVKAFAGDKLKLNYSIDSLMNVDIFFLRNSRNGRPKNGGRLSKNMGSTLFAIGSYVGETIIKNYPGAKWVTDDSDPEGEINAIVLLPDGTQLWPMHRTMKRLQNGLEDSVYAYGHEITKEKTKKPFNPLFWELKEIKSNPWWKIW